MTRLLLALLAVLALAAPAAAQTGATTPPRGPTDPNGISKAERPDVKPEGHRLTTLGAQRIGLRDAKLRAERARFPGSRVETFLKGQTRWQVSVYSRDNKEVAQVLIEDATARVTESWTGAQVAWTMARGYPGAFGRKINAPWVWLPLAALFLLGLAERRARSWRHADALVLTAFGGVYALFCAARIDLSVPLVYPLLAYVFVRLLLIGLGRARPGPMRPLVPVAALAVLLVFLVGFRVALNVTDSNVIDVGYAGVIGADKLTKAQSIWGAFPKDNPSGDTYGPIAYAAYVPFEQLFPWTGRWDELDAAKAVALVSDLACVLLLLGIGRRVRDVATGVRLAFLWAACPFSLLVLNTNSNDGLLAALLLAAIFGAGSGPARGAWLAFAGWAKFAPLALGPLFLMHGRRDTRVPYLLSFAGVTVLSALIVLGWGDASRFLERTVLFQADRDAPFSVWGAYGWDLGQRVVQAAGVLLAVAVAVVPRRRDLVGLAALAGAVLVGLQLGTSYWFFLYVGWWLGPLLIAVAAVAPAAAPTDAAPAGTAPAAARSPLPAAEPART